MKFKSRELLAFLVILILIIGGYWFYKQGFLDEFGAVGDETAWRLQQEENTAQLIKAGNFEDCGKIDYKSAEGLDYETVCRNNIALRKSEESLDFAWCEKLDGKMFSIEDCQSRVLFLKLEKENDPEVCDSVQSPILKSDCLSAFWLKESVSRGDVNLCSQIGESERESLCRRNFSIENLIADKENFICDIFEGQDKDDCLNFQSFENGNGGVVCDLLIDFKLRSSCVFGN